MPDISLLFCNAFSRARLAFIRSLISYKKLQDGVPVKLVQGANAPLIEKTIKEQIQLEKDGQPHVAVRLFCSRDFL
jgi:hypothetical protein